MKLIEKKKSTSLLWSDAAVIALLNRIIDNKSTTCLIQFIGRRINKKRLQRDRDLLQTVGFRLIKVKSFYFERALLQVFPNHNNYFLNSIHGYTLIAISNTYKSKLFDLNTLFYLPYYYLTPTFIIANKAIDSRESLALREAINQNINHYHATYTYTTVAGIFSILTWLIKLQTLFLLNTGTAVQQQANFLLLHR